MLKLLPWLLLLFLCWPLALLALVLYPLVWLVLLPLRFWESPSKASSSCCGP